MKKKGVRRFGQSGMVLIGIVAAAVAPVLASEFYRVTVSRVDSNLYRDHNSKALIETRYCYEYATRDDAVLRLEGRYGNNKLIFSSNQSCDVVAVR